LSQAEQGGLAHGQRKRLGTELSRFRRLSGLSGRAMASRIGASQAHVSRVESGQAVPTLPQVQAWADAAGIPADDRPALVALTVAALNEVDSWQQRDTADLAAMQRDVAGLEAAATISHHFQPAIVPGMLQTADYARHVLAITDIRDWGDHEAAVTARMERQRALHRPGRRWEFLLTEAALRLRLGPPHVMAGQMTRIKDTMALSNVDIGIVPLDADAIIIPWCAFHVYEGLPDGQGAFVAMELPHGRLTISDPADVSVYMEQLAAIRRAAVHKDAAGRLLDELMSY
jgi:transcriptional regulator with XRE-family HTH domain